MWTAKEIRQPYMIAYGASAGIGDAAVRQYAEAGVNIIQMNNWYEVSDATKTNISKIAPKYHIGILPWAMFDPARREGLIPRWSPDPCIFGWFMWDEPGRGERPLSLYRDLYVQVKQWSGGLPLVGTWDDPVWGNNIASGMIDILGYAVAYPWGTDILDPYAFTTGRCHLYRGTLRQAQEAGIIVIPVLQSWVNKGVIPDPPGQYQAYLDGFPTFDPSTYLYDPVNHIIKVPEIKAYVQQLTVQLGGTIWKPPETFTIQETTCPEDKSVFRVKVSSIAEHNKTLICPVDGTDLPLRGVEITEIVAIPLIAILQSEIATLNEKIAELQDTIEALKAQIAEARAIIGV